MKDRLICADCSASFGAERAARLHEHLTDHDVRAVDMSRHAVDVRVSERLEAQTPRGRRERHLDGQGRPRGDY